MKMKTLLTLAVAAILWIPTGAEGEPRFVAQTIDSDIQIGYGLAVGDVNGDGKDDILLADKRNFFWYENPSWERHLFWTLSTEDNREAVRDNVSITARDLDGDGKVEVAVGTNWNPGETVSEEKSGGVWFVGSLGRIAPKKLPHEPTTHRMGWVRGKTGYSLVVIPLHGRENKGGSGENGSRIFAYESGQDPYDSQWKQVLIEDRFHQTHNFDIIQQEGSGAESLLLGGKEGIALAARKESKWKSEIVSGIKYGSGELRIVEMSSPSDVELYTSIEPMHGNNVVYYENNEGAWSRTVLDDSLNQGHALVVADFLGADSLQIVAGWRNPDQSGKVGIRLYQQSIDGNWMAHTIDDNSMACEDMKAADLDGDGKIDLIASGRRSKNVIIYWNQSSI